MGARQKITGRIKRRSKERRRRAGQKTGRMPESRRRSRWHRAGRVPVVRPFIAACRVAGWLVVGKDGF
jgi:hypothetical protein